jgi:hypothetical protein
MMRRLVTFPVLLIGLTCIAKAQADGIGSTARAFFASNAPPPARGINLPLKFSIDRGVEGPGLPAPAEDMTAGLVCDGSADNTVQLQTILSSFNNTGYGRLVVPYTGHLCIVGGFNNSISSVSGSGTLVTLTFSSGVIPTWVQDFGVGAPATVYGYTGTAIAYNGIWIVTTVTSTTIVLSSTSMVSGSPTGGSVSIGPWTNAIVSIDGECTARLLPTQCSGFTTPSGDSPIYLLSSVPCTTAISTTCPSGQNSNALSLHRLNFEAQASTGAALGGVYIEQANGFEIYDSNFEGFTAAAGNGVGSGAAITLDGASSSTYVQNGFVANNKLNDDKYGVTFRNLVSGTTFLTNHAVCASSSYAMIPGSIGFDAGFTWVQNSGATNTGGENTWLGNEEEGCQIGYILDYQNFDRIWSKAELTANQISASGGPPSYLPAGNTVAFSILSSSDITLGVQSKNYCVGWHEDTNSSEVNVQNPQIGLTNGNCAHISHISVDGGSSAYAKDVVDYGARSTTAVTGLVDTLSAGTPQFTTDSLPALALGVAQSDTGTLTMAGITSGTVTITPQSMAGTPTLTLPNTTGTFAVGTSAPLALSATTGNLTITGQTGEVLAGSTPAFTATPVLGVQNSTPGSLTVAGTTGTPGTVVLGDAGSSGGITLAAPASGTGTQTFQAISDTVVDLTTTDTLYNKNLVTAAATASSGNSVTQLSSVMNYTSPSGLTGTAGTYTLPAYTLSSTGCIHIKTLFTPSSVTHAVTYTLNFGGGLSLSSGGLTATGTYGWAATACNASGTVYFQADPVTVTTTALPQTAALFTNNTVTLSSPVTISLTYSVSTTAITVTANMWEVWLDQ